MKIQDIVDRLKKLQEQFEDGNIIDGEDISMLIDDIERARA